MARIISSILIMVFLRTSALAQNENWDNFKFVDSLITSQLYAGQFSQLLKSSENAIKAGTRYSKLFTYRGYAFLKLNQPQLASDNYRKALHLNSSNNDALLGWYLANLEMNQNEKANYYAYPEENFRVQNPQKTVPFKFLNSFNADFSFKFPQESNRKPAQYFGMGISSRLNKRMYFKQQLALFHQRVILNEPTYATDKQGKLIMPLVYRDVEKNIKQYQYYAKLNYLVLPNLQLYSAYHGLNSNISETQIKSNVLILGLNAQLSNFHQGASLVSGKLYGNSIRQFHIQTTWYPFHNLSFYTSAGLTFLQYNSTQTSLPDFSLGWKVNPKLWMEYSLIYGKYSNALFNEGSLWFNTIDNGKLRTGLTGLFSLNPKLNLALSYHLEKFDYQTNSQSTQYLQNSITTGIIWKP